MIRIAFKSTARAALGLVAALALYIIVAIVCAMSPLRGRAQAIAADDPALFVCASAIHTDIVVPLKDDAADWRSAFAGVAGDVADTAYLAIGWGDLGFYHDTPTWADLRARTVLIALAGLDPTTLHVFAVKAPTNANNCVQIAIDRAGRQALARFILATAENDAAGNPRLIDSPRAGEAFYAAKGRYGPWRTCNVWASQALAEAGLPVALWAPFSFGVTWPLTTAHRT
jgi:uncharacterized protein (TIGR02117 family)